MALSTTVALFLPEFGPKDIMSGGVGVIIRATMIVPFVFSLLYWAGRLIINLTNKLKKRWIMSIITAGIEQGIHDVAKRRSKAAEQAAELRAEAAEQAAWEAARQAIEQAVREATEQAAKDAAEQVAQAREAAEQAVREAAKNAAEQAAQARDAAEQAAQAKDAAEQAAQARNLEREQVRRFMRVQGLSEEQIDAFFRQLSVQD